MPPLPPTMPSLFDIAASNARIALVYVGSVLLVVGVAVWAKYTSHPEFKMVHTLDMALAAVDFGGDVLFSIEAFEKGAAALGVVTSILLGFSSFASLCACSWMIYHSWRAKKNGDAEGDLINWEGAGSNASLYALIVILSATNSELVKLYPWTEHGYDGFPVARLAVRVTMLAFLEDLPQLICQLVFMATVEASPVAVASFAVTLVDLMWRVIKRTLRVMAREVRVAP